MIGTTPTRHGVLNPSTSQPHPGGYTSRVVQLLDKPTRLFQTADENLAHS